MKYVMLIFVTMSILSTTAWSDPSSNKSRLFPHYLDISQSPFFDTNGQVWLINGHEYNIRGAVSFGDFAGSYCQISAPSSALQNQTLVNGALRWEVTSCEIDGPVSTSDDLDSVHYGLCYVGPFGTLHLDCYEPKTSHNDNTYSPRAIQWALGSWVTLSKETINLTPAKQK